MSIDSCINPTTEVPVQKTEDQVKQSINDLFNDPDKLGESMEIEAGDKQVDIDDVIDPLSVSQAQLIPRVLTYQDKINQETQDVLKRHLQTLYEFGFYDFERNKELLVKFDLNIETVAGVLMN